MRTKQYGARKEAEDHAIPTVHHSSLSLSLSLSRVAPTKEKAQNYRARSRSARDLPQNLAGRKSGLSALPHPADFCPTLCLPTNCGAPFSTLPESLTILTFHLRAHLCSPTKGILWELDENKRILMGC
jgi:hypothetical protein